MTTPTARNPSGADQPIGLKTALTLAKPLFERLQGFYRRLPETRCECQKPGGCCRFLPQMTVLEALGWLDAIQSRSAAEQIAVVTGFVRFYLTTPLEQPGCPFLLHGGCSFYQRRTFACRAYGIWSQKTGRSRTLQNRHERKTLMAMWKKFGIELPPEPVATEIDYCRQVRVLSAGRHCTEASDDQLRSILQQIYDLGEELRGLQTRFEELYQSDFSFWLTAQLMGHRKAVLGKYAVIKELVQQGSDKRLKKALKKIDAARIARLWQ